LSTAVGCAIANSDKIVFCIIGDITAIYDAHGLWGELPKNLRLVVFNNGGGRIFDWIDGPNQYAELRTWIHTPQHKHFKHLSDFYGISHALRGIKEVNESISLLLNAPDALLLELVSEL
jgi:2-succinyl-5-enolpyruvyl-6-hydroxy-3-cyclohexene-1-carboxylate synthase